MRATNLTTVLHFIHFHYLDPQHDITTTQGSKTGIAIISQRNMILQA